MGKLLLLVLVVGLAYGAYRTWKSEWATNLRAGMSDSSQPAPEAPKKPAGKIVVGPGGMITVQEAPPPEPAAPPPFAGKKMSAEQMIMARQNCQMARRNVEVLEKAMREGGEAYDFGSNRTLQPNELQGEVFKQRHIIAENCP